MPEEEPETVHTVRESKEKRVKMEARDTEKKIQWLCAATENIVKYKRREHRSKSCW